MAIPQTLRFYLLKITTSLKKLLEVPREITPYNFLFVTSFTLYNKKLHIFIHKLVKKTYGRLEYVGFKFIILCYICVGIKTGICKIIRSERSFNFCTFFIFSGT